MPDSKESVLELLKHVNGLGPSTAEIAYEEFNVRTFDDLIALGESGQLAGIKGVGEVRAPKILESARALKENPPKPKVRRRRGRPRKTDAANAAGPGAEKKRRKPGPKPGSKRKPKAAEPTAQASRAEQPKAERPRPQQTYTPPAPKQNSNPVVFLGKLVFKIAKKLLS